MAGAWLSGACLSIFIALVGNRNVVFQMLLGLCLNSSGMCDSRFLLHASLEGSSNSAVVNITAVLTMWAVPLVC